jgi:hypothetical protein
MGESRSRTADLERLPLSASRRNRGYVGALLSGFRLADFDRSDNQSGGATKGLPSASARKRISGSDAKGIIVGVHDRQS